MFTGIVEALGTVSSLQAGRLIVEVNADAWPDPLVAGESIAVNGCCLTVTAPSDALPFDLSPETLARTSLGDLKPGSIVNLERAMRADGRFGGHIVQGHVDTTAKIISIIPSGNSVVYRFEVSESETGYLIDKGSVTLDGISLTVVEPRGNDFCVWVIPHTLENTNLSTREPGDRVNLEFDLIAKYVERLCNPR